MITIEKKSLAGYSFIDLFAGLGGFRIALESLGAKCVYSNEWNVPVQKVYADNFGDIPEGDITQVDENTIRIMISSVPDSHARRFRSAGSSGGLRTAEVRYFLMLREL